MIQAQHSIVGVIKPTTSVVFRLTRTQLSRSTKELRDRRGIRNLNFCFRMHARS
jgi:hypothetical protein